MTAPAGQKAKMLAGELYLATDPQLVAEDLRAQELLYRFHLTRPDAGSVVTRDLPAGVLAVGNPCRVLRDL
jgi:hypothetical protein